jgi:hypothetical protein
VDLDSTPHYANLKKLKKLIIEDEKGEEDNSHRT